MSHKNKVSNVAAIKVTTLPQICFILLPAKPLLLGCSRKQHGKYFRKHKINFAKYNRTQK